MNSLFCPRTRTQTDGWANWSQRRQTGQNILDICRKQKQTGIRQIAQKDWIEAEIKSQLWQTDKLTKQIIRSTKVCCSDAMGNRQKSTAQPDKSHVLKLKKATDRTNRSKEESENETMHPQQRCTPFSIILQDPDTDNRKLALTEVSRSRCNVPNTWQDNTH